MIFCETSLIVNPIMLHQSKVLPPCTSTICPQRQKFWVIFENSVYKSENMSIYKWPTFHLHVFVKQEVTKDAFIRETLGGKLLIFGYTVGEELNTKFWIVHVKRQAQEEGIIV